jgi:multisite-specific tRNA:(cytosine-C5)-methyltransferase
MGRKNNRPKPKATNSNPLFEAYYLAQGIVEPTEWEQFLEVLRTPIPTCFRISCDGQLAELVSSRIVSDFLPKLQVQSRSAASE